jgi:hypothetical protein
MTWKPILTAVLTDVTITDAEARLINYLAAQPPGRTVYPDTVARELKRSLRHWVLPTLKLLHARGMLAKSGGRRPGEANTPLTYTVNCDLIIATTRQASDLGSAGSDTTPDLGSAGSVRTGSGTTAKREPAAQRGTRIPADFIDRLRADREQIDWFRAECPDVDGRVENQKFMNYWLAKTGQGATKRDWIRTWRNWMLKAQQDAADRRARFGPRAQPGEEGWVQPVSPYRDLD